MSPDELLPHVYGELHKLAAAKLRSEAVGHTLDATALVNEAWLKLNAESFASKSGFFRAAAVAMRRILVDHARAKKANKRGGDRQRVPLETIEQWRGTPEDLLDLDEALERFAAVEPLKARLVELRFFSGMPLPEVADTLGISLASAERWWTFARLWLHAELSDKKAENS